MVVAFSPGCSDCCCPTCEAGSLQFSFCDTRDDTTAVYQIRIIGIVNGTSAFCEDLNTTFASVPYTGNTLISVGPLGGVGTSDCAADYSITYPEVPYDAFIGCDVYPGILDFSCYWDPFECKTKFQVTLLNQLPSTRLIAYLEVDGPIGCNYFDEEVEIPLLTGVDDGCCDYSSVQVFVKRVA